MDLCGCTIYGETMYFSNYFNEPMDAYYELMKDVKILIFDEDCFNEKYSQFNQLV